jgi:hypothetical protein
MPLCGEAHIKNVTTAGRPSQTNGMMVWDSDIKQLLASCGGTWHKSGCNYITPPNIPSCWLVVAGGGVGGAWGSYGAGGGGAGGAICGTTDFSTLTWYCVVIGAGGSSFGANGSNSCFAGTLANGGGNGGGPVPGFPFDQNPSGDGGSGGAPASRSPSSIGLGTAGQGNDGGCGYNAPVIVTPFSYSFAGGGGGKGSQGEFGCAFSPFSNTNGCYGGGGCGIVLDNILTMPVYAAGTRNNGNFDDCGVAGGGGGGGCVPTITQGFGRAGGGCAGGAAGGAGGDGCVNTGGGGGASKFTGDVGSGGSGVIIIFHDLNYKIATSTPTITFTTQCDNTTNNQHQNGCVSTVITGGDGCICFLSC